jgi:hypothetical protein
MPPVLLLGCVQTKLDHPAAAADLFVSPLFRARRQYALRTASPWFVLSSAYGVLLPEQVVAPYDQPMARRPADARQAWGDLVIAQLTAELGGLAGLTFEIHAGSAYVDPIEPRLAEHGATVLAPFRGLGLGQHLAWYSARV